MSEASPAIVKILLEYLKKRGPRRYRTHMADREFKQALYREFARVSGALANDHRLEIIDVLTQAPRHVDALAAETGLSIANTSQHLQVLKEARLVASEREGTRVVYRLADDSVLSLWLALRDVGAARLADVAALIRSRALGPYGAEVLSIEEFDALRAGGEAVVIDVRPREEYAFGHLEEALSIPVDDLPDRLHELPRDRQIVAYCRGAYCTFAEEAVSLLRAHGFRAARTEDGWTEWRARRVVTTTSS